MQATDEPTTDVYHDGDEVAVRLNSKTSRKYHTPKTDERGDVVFDDDGYPEPACGKGLADGRRWILRPVSTISRRDSCRNCAEDADTISERNASGSGNLTLARLAQRSDWDGGESLSANASQSD